MTLQTGQYLRAVLLLIIFVVLSFSGCQTTEQTQDGLASQISIDQDRATPREPEMDGPEQPEATEDATEDATKSEDGHTIGATERAGATPSETRIEDSDFQISSPAVAEPSEESVSPVDERAVATADQPEMNVSDTRVWSPPSIIAQSPPDRVVVRTLSQWINDRPIAVYFDGDGEDRAIRRQVIFQLMEDGGIRYLPVDSPSVAENMLVFIIADRQQETSRGRHYYGTTEVQVKIAFPGEDEVISAAIVTGPNVFSSVSYRDAVLNSLCRVNPRSLRRAVIDLRREVSSRLAQRGLSYRFTVDPRGDEPVQHAIFRSIGIPGETDNIWYIPYTPEEVEQRISDAIIGSRYRLEMNRSTRSGRLVVHEEP